VKNFLNRFALVAGFVSFLSFFLVSASIAADRTPFDGAARWIWSEEGVSGSRPDSQAYRVRYFRRNFYAPADASLVVCVTADTRYKFWCNGRLLARGPAKGDIAHHFYQRIDLSSYLLKGKNSLAAQVEYQGDVWPDYRLGGGNVSLMTAAPGFLLDGILVDADGRVLETVHSDARWKVMIDRAYRYQIDPGCSNCVGLYEDFHSSAFPWNFENPEFDDSGWAAAREVVAGVAGWSDRDSSLPHRLLPRMIAQLEESAPKHFEHAFRSSAEDLGSWNRLLLKDVPLKVPPRARQEVLIHAGELTTGYPMIHFSGGGKDSMIRLQYAEALTDEKGLKSRRDDFSFGRLAGCRDWIRTDGFEHTWEPFFFRTFRFMKVEVETGPEPLVIHSLRYRFTAYPFEELAKLETSDPQHAAIWDMCWRTARLCAHETYEDCPYYEQLQYAGDTQVQALISYYVAGDASLAKQFLYHFDWSRQSSGLTRSRYPSRVPQTIPYWSLHWVMSVYDYWIFTGDLTTLKSLIPGISSVMGYFLGRVDEGDLVRKLDGWLVADWCPTWKPSGMPPGADKGQAAYDSLITLVALQKSIELADALEIDCRSWREDERKLREAIQLEFYDPERHLYTDTKAESSVSAFTNVWAILAGMPVDANRLNDPFVAPLTMFSQFFGWRALAQANRYERFPETLEPWNRMVQWGLTTCPEIPDFVRSRSDCHAWSAGPLVEFCREILGVRPLEPGWRVIGVEPKPAGLSWARGRVPLTRINSQDPPSYVEVEWKIEAGDFQLQIEVPKGRQCRVRLPDGDWREFPLGGSIDLRVPLMAE